MLAVSFSLRIFGCRVVYSALSICACRTSTDVLVPLLQCTLHPFFAAMFRILTTMHRILFMNHSDEGSEKKWLLSVQDMMTTWYGKGLCNTVLAMVLLLHVLQNQAMTLSWDMHTFKKQVYAYIESRSESRCTVWHCQYECTRPWCQVVLVHKILYWYYAKYNIHQEQHCLQLHTSTC